MAPAAPAIASAPRGAHRPNTVLRSDQPQKRNELSMTLTAVHSAPQTSAAKRPARTSDSQASGAISLARLNEAGLPPRPISPRCDDGWSLTSHHQTGTRDSGGQPWTAARRAGNRHPELSVAAADIRYHVKALACAGMTLELIAEIAVLAVTDVAKARSPRTTVIPTRIAEALLAITFHPTRGRTLTPSIGAYRRLRALNAMGYNDDDIAARLNVPPATVTDMPKADLIASTLWHNIVEVYDELSMTLGPDHDLRTSARAAGVVPPLGWDDDDIDHPRAVRQDRVRGPIQDEDHAAIIRAVRGDRVALRVADKRTLVRLAVQRKWSAPRLALALGITAESAHREMSRSRHETNMAATPTSEPPASQVGDRGACAAPATPGFRRRFARRDAAPAHRPPLTRMNPTVRERFNALRISPSTPQMHCRHIDSDQHNQHQNLSNGVRTCVNRSQSPSIDSLRATPQSVSRRVSSTPTSLPPKPVFVGCGSPNCSTRHGDSADGFEPPASWTQPVYAASNTSPTSAGARSPAPRSLLSGPLLPMSQTERHDTNKMSVPPRRTWRSPPPMLWLSNVSTHRRKVAIQLVSPSMRSRSPHPTTRLPESGFTRLSTSWIVVQTSCPCLCDIHPDPIIWWT